jgi:hypothetical protein
LIEFKDSFIRNGYYKKNFEEITEVGAGDFSNILKARPRKNNESLSVRKNRVMAESLAVKKLISI